jgi:hypothetical protein
MPANDHPPANQPALGCLLRFFWMAIGNVVLLLVGVQFIQSDQHLSGLDAAFWLIVFLTFNARFVDIRCFAGTDGWGVPSTLADWRRYATKMVSLAAVVRLVCLLSLSFVGEP